MRKQGPITPRFWAKVEKTSDINACWNWLGAKTKGYGNFSYGGRGGKTVRAHRFSYILINGPIPDGLALDHLCRNTLCVNPAHLEAVTDRVNFLRSHHPNALKHVEKNRGLRHMKRRKQETAL